MSHNVRRFVIPAPENPDDPVVFVKIPMPWPIARILDVAAGFEGDESAVVLIVEATEDALPVPFPSLEVALVKDGGEIPDDYQPVEWVIFDASAEVADERMVYVPTSVTFGSPIP